METFYIVQYLDSWLEDWVDLSCYELLCEAKSNYDYRVKNQSAKFRLIKQTVEILKVSSFVVKSCDREF